MRKRTQASIGMAALLLLASASAAGQREYPDSDRLNEETFQNALTEIRVKDYEQGRHLLKKLVIRKCPLACAAMLLIADSYYREGGSRNLAEAESGYTRWLDLFPEQELAPLVMKKTAEAYLRELNGRDGSNHLALADRTLTKLQELYPQFGADPQVQEYVMVTQELRAQHELKVARFYLEMRESPTAAKMRCLEIVTKLPKFSGMDDALWLLAQADEQLAQSGGWEENTNEAITCYERIVREHFDSEYLDRALERLRYFGREAPEPDPEINAAFRERAAQVKRMLVNGYVFDISPAGVFLNEEDEVDNDALISIQKQVSLLHQRPTRLEDN